MLWPLCTFFKCVEAALEPHGRHRIILGFYLKCAHSEPLRGSGQIRHHDRVHFSLGFHHQLGEELSAPKPSTGLFGDLPRLSSNVSKTSTTEVRCQPSSPLSQFHSVVALSVMRLLELMAAVHLGVPLSLLFRCILQRWFACHRLDPRLDPRSRAGRDGRSQTGQTQCRRPMYQFINCPICWDGCWFGS